MSNILNDIMGVSSSAKSAYRYNMNLQHDAQNFAKWQMANSHQQEVADLQKAGLNPVLSAGAGGGASAGVSANSTGTGTGAGMDPISMASAIVNMMNSSKQTNAEVKKAENEITNNTNLTNANIRHLDAETENINQNTELNVPDEETAKALKWWNSTWVGKAFNVGGHIMSNLSPFITPAVNYAGAKQIAKKMGQKDSTTTTNHYNSKGKLTGSTTKTTRH